MVYNASKQDYANSGEVEITGTTTLRVDQQHVFIRPAAAFTLTLPHVAAAIGRIYTINLIAGGHAVTLASEGSTLPSLTGDFDTAGERVALYSDGRNWYILSDNTATE